MKQTFLLTFHRFFSRVETLTLRYIRSPNFFYFVVVLLVIQSLWIALSAVYPQAFDENYHFGLIKLHAGQLLPFFTQQPPGGDIYGAVVRDPSYLYHYLLSFPYRLMTALNFSETAQIVIFRLLNIGIFVAGLYVFRKLLRALNISAALTHVVLFFFVLTPIVPLLAAQINYDNLMFVITGLVFVLLVRFLKTLRTDNTVDGYLLLQIGLYGIIGSLVKFPFAPIFFSVLMICAFFIIQALWVNSEKHYGFVFEGKRYLLIFYSVLTVVMAVLFIERYGINLIKYRAPVPKCDVVLSVEACMSYSPWARDYLFAASYPSPTPLGIAVYPAVWVHRTVWETGFTVSSRWSDEGTVVYQARPPLTVLNYTAWTIVTLGAVLAVMFIKRLWGMFYLRVLLLVCTFYIVVLFLQNFSMYLHSGEAVAIHGRYLIPIYPVLYLALALVFSWIFEKIRKTNQKTWLLIIVTIFVLQGGGILTWLYRSEDSWFWPENGIVREINSDARNVVRRLVIP